MKQRKYIGILLIFIICMLTISAVSAADDASNDISSINDNEELILEENHVANNLNEANEELILEESPNKVTLNVEKEKNPLTDTTGNFTELNNLINDNTDPVINLDKNYVYSTGDNMIEGITINREVTINGNGYTIN